MSVDLKLNPTQERYYNRALVSASKGSHSNYVEVSAELLDRNRNHVGWIKNRPGGAWSGQVNLDVSNATNADGTETGSIWTANLDSIDPGNHLQLDSRAGFLDRMLRINWGVYVPEILGNQHYPDGMVTRPIFCGPCSAPVVSGDNISIQAQGKEIWARGAVGIPKTWPKGMRITDVIHDIWVNHIGEPEAWVRIPQLPDRLPDAYRVGPGTHDKWWASLLYLATVINCDAYYGRDSIGHLQQRPGRSVYILEDGPYGAIINTAQRTTAVGPDQADSIEGIPNRFIVIGQPKPQKPPKHGKPPKPPVISGHWDIPAKNKFSARSNGNPGGDGLIVTDEITLEHVHTDEACKRIAEMRGRRSLQLADLVTDETVVVPHLNPFDTYRREAAGGVGYWEVLQNSIPLDWSPEHPQTWNFIRQLTTAGGGIVRHR